ncbi:unnamed protein product [Symbiodinium natans]|uniref:Uncharacterized protein n=1 Tax=Symbiodinium natans TaxID=878477 RepID=A0A812TYJ5_9DINO|nr:unnamed protein product [Symbiodinium natans]
MARSTTSDFCVISEGAGPNGRRVLEAVPVHSRWQQCRKHLFKSGFEESADLAGSVLCFCVMFPAVLPCQVRTAVVFLKQFQFIQDGSNVESIYSKGASRNPQIFADGFQQEVSVHVPQGLQRFPNCFDFRMPQKCGSAS